MNAHKSTGWDVLVGHDDGHEHTDEDWACCPHNAWHSCVWCCKNSLCRVPDDLSALADTDGLTVDDELPRHGTMLGDLIVGVVLLSGLWGFIIFCIWAAVKVAT